MNKKIISIPESKTKLSYLISFIYRRNVYIFCIPQIRVYIA